MTKFIETDTIFYHGTRNQFDRFRPLSHFGSRRAAQHILDNRVASSEIFDIIRDKQFDMAYCDVFDAPAEPQIPGRVIPVQLNMDNTYEIQDIAGHHEFNYFRGAMLYHITHEMQIAGVPKFIDDMFVEPFRMPADDVRAELMSDTLYPVATARSGYYLPHEIDQYHLCSQRMIHYFESMGYDGFHYNNRIEDRGHTSYIVFRSENVHILGRTPLVAHPHGGRVDMTPIRPITDEEKYDINLELDYHYTLNTHKRDLYTNTNLARRYETLRRATRAKIYYMGMFYDEILPQIRAVTHQAEFGYHGLNHTAQVAMYALECAITTATDPLPVLIAAGLHDCARTNDSWCLNHGPAGAAIAQKFIAKNYPNMMPITRTQIAVAIADHTIGRNAPDLISGCLWDGDRIRLSWEEEFRPEFFHTPFARKIASLGIQAQFDYCMRQNDFLVRHGIKSRDAVDYEWENDYRSKLFAAMGIHRRTR